MSSVDTIFSLTTRFPTSVPQYPKNSIRKHATFAARARWRAPILRRSFTVLCELKSGQSGSGESNKPVTEDFVTRVLKENPSQVEPRYRVGDKLYNLKEREGLSKGENPSGAFEFIRRKFDSKTKTESEIGKESVYLSDILREYKGKLYVPEQVFGPELSEEEEFERNVKDLPKMSLEDFRKAMKNDKVKLLTSKEDSGVAYTSGFRDFIVDLKEIPGVKSLQRTKWSMKLEVEEAQALLKEYTGPQYEIERHMTSWVGKVADFPNPVASSISSRVMVELGMVTAVIAAAAVVVGGFLASAVFAVTSFTFITTVYVVWPIVRPFLKLFLGIILGVVERTWDYLVDFLGDGGIFSRISDFYTFGGGSSSVEMLKPILLVVMTMVLLVRFTLSRRPKNFRKWDLWQGIAFSQSKAEALVDGSTGVKFGDVAGIDEAVDELQEVPIDQ